MSNFTSYQPQCICSGINLISVQKASADTLLAFLYSYTERTRRNVKRLLAHNSYRLSSPGMRELQLKRATCDTLSFNLAHQT